MDTFDPHPTSLRIGYARVSTHEQSLDSQIDALKQADCGRIYCDRISGTKAERAELDRLKDVLRPGDTLVLWRLDRLGRSLRDLITWTDWLSQSGIALHSLTEQIDTSHPAGKLTFHLFAALAEFERNLIRERTLSGLQAARARGRNGGRPPKLDATGIRQLKALHQDPSLLIRNGLLYGYDSTQQGMTQIQRGQRIRCSNRGAHSGCGRSFAIYEPETLPRRSVSSAFLFALLKALLDHAGCVHYAWQQGTRWFSLSTAYRMWEALRLHQTQLRHRLCERTAAPASAKYEPRLQLIAHLCAAFEDEDPIKAYHEHFQQPLLPGC